MPFDWFTSLGLTDGQWKPYCDLIAHKLTIRRAVNDGRRRGFCWCNFWREIFISTTTAQTKTSHRAQLNVNGCLILPTALIRARNGNSSKNGRPCAQFQFLEFQSRERRGIPHWELLRMQWMTAFFLGIVSRGSGFFHDQRPFGAEASVWHQSQPMSLNGWQSSDTPPLNRTIEPIFSSSAHQFHNRCAKRTSDPIVSTKRKQAIFLAMVCHSPKIHRSVNDRMLADCCEIIAGHGRIKEIDRRRERHIEMQTHEINLVIRPRLQVIQVPSVRFESFDRRTMRNTTLRRCKMITTTTTTPTPKNNRRLVGKSFGYSFHFFGNFRPEIPIALNLSLMNRQRVRSLFAWIKNIPGICIRNENKLCSVFNAATLQRTLQCYDWISRMLSAYQTISVQRKLHRNQQVIATGRNLFKTNGISQKNPLFNKDPIRK